MIVRSEPEATSLESPLGRASPLTKLAVAVGWFVGLALTTSLGPPLFIAAVALVAAVVLGRVPVAALVRSLALLWFAALSVAVFNTLFHASNGNLVLPEIARLGPFRITELALRDGIGLAGRVLAIAAVGVTFARTTDPTRLVDALVQQAGVPERFAYGALAAYQAIPRFAEDLATLRQARRIRGLRTSWHPRILVGLLVLAIRHADRLALAMDARGFGAGPRSRYRLVSWGWIDFALVLSGVAVVLVALQLR